MSMKPNKEEMKKTSAGKPGAPKPKPVEKAPAPAPAKPVQKPK